MWHLSKDVACVCHWCVPFASRCLCVAGNELPYCYLLLLLPTRIRGTAKVLFLCTNSTEIFPFGAREQWVSSRFYLMHKTGQKLKFQADALEVWSCASTGGARCILMYGRPERSFALSGWAPCCSCQGSLLRCNERHLKIKQSQKSPKPSNEDALLQWQSVSVKALEDT